MSNHFIPLSQWLLERSCENDEQRLLYGILQDVSLIGKEISELLKTAGLYGLVGSSGSTNSSGDVVHQLDIQSNAICKSFLESTSHFAAMVSEEEEGIIQLPQGKDSPYVIAFDPIDGSKNLDVNGPVATIATIYTRKSTIGSPATEEDFLQNGRGIVAAMYVLYGPSTVMVFSVGDGVHSCALDPSTKEWMLLADSIRIPETFGSFAHNDVYVPTWDEKSREFFSAMKQRHPESTARHIGTFAADMHRTLLHGGIFFRPFDDAILRKAKLRIVFELRAFAFLLQQAGGYATTGEFDMLDVKSTSLHAVSAFIGGDADEVRQYEQLYQ